MEIINRIFQIIINIFALIGVVTSVFGFLVWRYLKKEETSIVIGNRDKYMDAFIDANKN
jgi:hypothetical protein